MQFIRHKIMSVRFMRLFVYSIISMYFIFVANTIQCLKNNVATSLCRYKQNKTSVGGETNVRLLLMFEMFALKKNNIFD